MTYIKGSIIKDFLTVFGLIPFARPKKGKQSRRILGYPSTYLESLSDEQLSEMSQDTSRLFELVK